VSAEGILEKAEGGYRFTEVLLHPQLTINSEANRDRALRLLEKAEHACLISRSVSSKIVMLPEIFVVVAA
jgi:organic hydroperoxide reductase OsmC/OhrA